jgi:hypothetical protein
MTMKSKIVLILRALLLIVGMFALQGCFEEEYRGYEPGYAPAYRYSYESPRLAPAARTATTISDTSS